MLSRVADNLYWMSRYLERAEHTARLLDVNLDEMLDQTPAASDRRWELLLYSLQLNPDELLPAGSGTKSPELLVDALTVNANNSFSIVSLVNMARENARQVREQISTEMWIQLNQLYQRLKKTSVEDIWEESPHTFLQHWIKDEIQKFQGITDATMSHGEGWHFIQIGRCIERALATTTLLDVHFQANESMVTQEAYERDLEWVALLKSCTSFEAYCKVYMAQIQPEWVAEFLFLSADSPRSVRFAADCILDSVRAIAAITGRQRGDRVTRLSGRLSSTLDYGAVEEIMEESLHVYCDDICAQCVKIHDAIYSKYIQSQEILAS